MFWCRWAQSRPASTCSPPSSTKTSTSRSGIVIGQPDRPNAAGQRVAGAKPADVRFIGIQGFRQVFQDAQATEDPQETLQADPTIALLEARLGRPGDAGAIGQLSLGEAPELAPGGDVFGQATGGSFYRGRSAWPGSHPGNLT